MADRNHSKNPRRRSGIDGVEVAIRRLRLLGAALLVGVALTGRTALVTHTRLTSASLVALAVVLVIVNILGRAFPDAAATTKGTVGQLGLDAAVTVAAIWALNPATNSYLLVITGLPVLHGTLRYRLNGAFAVWLAIAAGLCLRTILDWSPGAGLQPIFELVTPMAIALAAAIPAGHLADQLTDDILRLNSDRADAQRRARLLAVLTIAAQDLDGARHQALAETVVHATVELGYAGADFVTIDGQLQTTQAACGAIGEPLERQIITFGQAGSSPAAPQSQLHVWVDPAQATWSPQQEALELLRRSATNALRTLAGYEDLNAAIVRHRHNATHDPLTGALNRAGLLQALSERLGRLTLSNEPFAVFVLDLDGFKAVNDTHGHLAGDAVLQAATARLRAAVPNLFALARPGGDEFVLLTASDGAASAEITQAVYAAFENPFSISYQEIHVGVSAGCHVVTEAATTPEDALRAADQRMYEAKRHGHGESALPAAGAAATEAATEPTAKATTEPTKAS